MEVMVAVGVMGIVAVGMMELQRSGVVAQKSLLAIDDSRSITDSIAQMMTISTACKNTFAGKSVLAPGSAITEIRDQGDPLLAPTGYIKFTTGTTSANVYGNRGTYLAAISVGPQNPPTDTKDTNADGVDDNTGQSYFLGTVPASGTAPGVATVTIRYVKLGQVVTTGAGAKSDYVGPQTFFRYFNINVTINSAGVIQTNPFCSSVSGQTITTNVTGTSLQNYIARWQDNNGSLTHGLMYDSGTGIGIGTTAPGQLLDIQGNTGGNVVIQSKNNGAGRAILQADSGAASDAAVKFYNQGAAIGGISAFPGNSLVFYGVGNTEQMRITSAGNAGIGTNNPQSLLQLGTGLNFYSNWPTVTFNTNAPSGTWLHTTTNSSSFITQDYTDNGLLFITSPSGTAGNPITLYSALFLSGTGNAGIGTVTVGSGTYPSSSFHPMPFGSCALCHGGPTGSSGTMSGGLTISGVGGTQLTVEKSASPGLALNTGQRTAGDFQLYDHAKGAFNISLHGYNSSIGLGVPYPGLPSTKIDVVGTAALGGNSGIDAYVILAADGSTGNPMIEGRNRSNNTKLPLLINPYGGPIGLGTNNPSANAIATGYSSNHGLLSYVYGTGWIGVLGQDTNGGCYGYLASGGYSAGGNCGTAFASDARLKEAITPVANGLQKILALKPVSFSWKNSGKNRSLPGKGGRKARNLGFLAQEVQRVFPDLVSEEGGRGELTEKVAGIRSPKNGWLALDYLGLIAPLMAAVQELKTALDQLVAELAGIRDAVAQLERDAAEAAAQLKAELRLEHDSVAAALGAWESGSRELASAREELSGLKAASEKLEPESRGLRQESDAIKAYLCAKDPKAPLCRPAAKAARRPGRSTGGAAHGRGHQPC